MKTEAPPTLQFRLAWRRALLAGFLLAACSKSVAAPDAPEEMLPRPHDTRTFFVPEGQPTFTALYAERAAANGSDSWLVQRVIRSTGHCDITPEERISAFDALVNWEENGVVPAGDDVLDPQVVADPTYGCAFTLVTRSGIPAC